LRCKHCNGELPSERKLDLCPHCERRVELASYTADPKQGLERLEREKLNFLKKSSTISKYEAENIKRFAVPERRDEVEFTDSFDFGGPTEFSVAPSFGATDVFSEFNDFAPSSDFGASSEFEHSTQFGLPLADYQDGDEVEDGESYDFGGATILEPGLGLGLFAEDQIQEENAQSHEDGESDPTQTDWYRFSKPAELLSEDVIKASLGRGSVEATPSSSQEQLSRDMTTQEKLPWALDRASKAPQKAESQRFSGAKILRPVKIVPRSQRAAKDLVQKDLVQKDLVQKDLVQKDLVQKDLVQKETKTDEAMRNSLSALIPEASVEEYDANFTALQFKVAKTAEREPVRQELDDTAKLRNSSLSDIVSVTEPDLLKEGADGFRASVLEIDEADLQEVDASDEFTHSSEAEIEQLSELKTLLPDSPDFSASLSDLKTLLPDSAQPQLALELPYSPRKELVRVSAAESEFSLQNDDAEAEESSGIEILPQVEEKLRANLTPFLWLGIFALLFLASLLLLYFLGYFDARRGHAPKSKEGQRVEVEQEEPESRLPREDIYNLERATRRASESAHRAFDFQAHLLPTLIKKAQEAQNADEAISHWANAHALFPHSLPAIHGLGNALIQAKRYREAREALRASQDAIAFDEETQALVLRAFREDPYFISPPEYIDDLRWDVIDPLGGGSTLTFKIQNKGKIIAALKPLQTRRQSNYRAEIAAWRICELLQCDFKVPYNKEVRVEKSVFLTMYSRSTSSRKDSYTPQLVDLIWTRHDGKEYLHATLKEWIEDFTRFPIEYTSLWKPWLAQNSAPAPSELKNSLAPIQERSRINRLYDKILAAAPDLDTQGLAAQIAQVLIFDYLTGNWDRFSGVEDWWGVNCQFAKNKIVSIDNGAAFQPYSNKKVLERFLLAQKYGRRFIRDLHALDKDETLALLFPDADSRELRSYEQFWRQRSALLAHVDSLVEQYGAENVYAFP